MAEMMAESKTRKENKSERATRRKSTKSAKNRESENAMTPAHEIETPRAEESATKKVANHSPQSDSQPTEPKLSAGEQLEELVVKNFPEIVEGLMKGISEGKPGGAKVLFDALIKLKSDQGAVEHIREVCTRFSEFLGPDLELVTSSQEEQPVTVDQAALDNKVALAHGSEAPNPTSN
jgi:hypothetical protein